MVDLMHRERLGFAPHISNGLAMLAAALIQQGQLDEALQHAREAARLMHCSGMLPLFLDHFALLAFKLGRSVDAARALGYTEAYFVEGRPLREPNEQLARDQLLIQLQQTLPEEELGHYMREGAVMSDEDVTRMALGE
jgi:hypothetical protein